MGYDEVRCGCFIFGVAALVLSTEIIAMIALRIMGAE